MTLIEIINKSTQSRTSSNHCITLLNCGNVRILSDGYKVSFQLALHKYNEADHKHNIPYPMTLHICVRKVILDRLMLPY